MERKPTFNPEYIRDLSEAAYRLRLEQDSPGNVQKMLGKDNDGGMKLRNRAAAYDPLTRCYLKVLGFEPDGVKTESDSCLSGSDTQTLRATRC